jgi:general secretion pathway protein K
MRAAKGTLSHRSRRSAGRKGIALLMVLWVLAILTVIVFSFAYMTRAETQAAITFKGWTTKKFLAEAGIERGIMEIFYRAQNLGGVPLEGLEVWQIDGTPYTVDTGSGRFVVSIVDESGKININTLTDSSGIILKDLLMNTGVQEEDADTIVDSVLDWKDKTGGDLHRLHGAGDDYYMSLPTPYKPRHDNFETLEELLLVKGVTPDILYGDGKRKGIIDFLTVHSGTRAINLMAAPREVLAAIPGLEADDVEQIISLRESQTDVAAIQAFTGKVTPPFNGLVNTGNRGSTFTLESVGYTGGEKTGYSVKATVNVRALSSAPRPSATGAATALTAAAARPPYRYLYYKSPAEVTYDRDNSR